MDREHKSFFLSDNSEEIRKEKEKQSAIHSFLPLTSGGNKDETEYVFIDKDKDKAESVSNKSFEIENKNDKTNNENNCGYAINPWMLEKTFDSLQNFKLAKPSGGYRTINYPRPTYSSKESFEKLNQSKFDSVIGYSFNFEGGYTNRKEDKETIYGITRPFLDSYKHVLAGEKSKPISELTKDDARRMYKAQWDRYQLGYVRDKELALLLNDYMINSNAKKVAERVQNILNSNGANLKIDGIFGKQTLNAIHNTDKDWLIEQILIDRLKRYQFTLDREPYKKIFIPGWIARLNKLAEYSKAKIRFQETDLKVK